MKYTPKKINGNVNISTASPIKDFFKLAAKILGIILIIYIALGLAVDYMAPRISTDLEIKLGRIFSGEFERKARSKADEQIQAILDNLVKNASLPSGFIYTVRVKESKEINAIALPGGNIVIYSALLKEIKSKNELAMVLAHELGHFAYRDHLRGLGRGLAFLVLSSVMLGTDSSVSRFIANSMNNVEMRFSQARETAADMYALDLLNKTYHHAAGAVDFYEKMAAKEKCGRLFYFFATHPYPESRVSAVKEAIKKNGYKVGEKISLDISGS